MTLKIYVRQITINLKITFGKSLNKSDMFLCRDNLL
jgi:hypothetical protein